jgi:glycosyltransferase involved in cell wall biosynthesis
MRIIIANPYFPPYAPGGAEFSLEQMCCRFVAEGWEIRVLTNCYDGKPRKELRDGYEVEFVESPVMLSEGQQIDATFYLRSRAYEERLFQSLVHAIGETDEKPLLIANNAQSLIGVAQAGAVTGVPTIGIVRDTQVICETGACIDNQPAASAIPCHGMIGAARCMLRFQRQRGLVGWRPVPSVLLDGVRNGWRRSRLRRRGLTQMTSVVTISDALRDLVRTIPRAGRCDIVTIRNFHTAVKLPAEVEVLNFLGKQGLAPNKYFLFAGRKTYGKGADLAVDAIKAVSAIQPDIKLLLLGREKVLSAADSSFVDHISVSQSLLLGVLKMCRAFLIPGRWQEGLNRTMIDALYMGVPIICSEAGAPPVEGVINGENGYVVKCNNASALAEKMLNILEWGQQELDHCRLVSTMRFSERFSDDVLLAAWHRIFGKLVMGEERVT